MFLSLALSSLAIASCRHFGVKALDESNVQHKTHENYIRGGRNMLSKTRNVREASYTQTQPCLLSLEEIEFDDGHTSSQWRCEVEGPDAEAAGVANGGSTAFAVVEGMEYIFAAKPDIRSGITTLLAKTATIDDHRIIITEEDELLFGEISHRRRGRRLAAKTGELQTLIARVTLPDSHIGKSGQGLSDDVFGTNGDTVNLKLVAERCSWNKVKIVPASGAYITNGVVEVQLYTRAAHTNLREITEQVQNSLKNTFRVEWLEERFDLVMINLPPGIRSSNGNDKWSAFAYVNSHVSVFNNEHLAYPGLQMHEVGHNWGLEHASEKKDEYGDGTGAMGANYFADDAVRGGKYCYNGAHSWIIGWYASHNVEVKPLKRNFEGKLAGVGKYPNIASDEKVVLRIANGITGYYIMFNHAVGINEGTWEGENRVTVVSKDDSYAESYTFLLANLAAGEHFAIPNFQGTGQQVTIAVDSIDSSASGHARVRVYIEGGAHNDVPVTPTKQLASSTITHSTCQDLGGWKNMQGDGCKWYDKKGCKKMGGDIGMIQNIPVTVACCRCRGDTSPGCVSMGGWIDEWGFDCSWYDTYEKPGCPDWNFVVGGMAVAASDACCDCKA